MGLNPNFKLPSKNTIKADVLGIYMDEKAKLYDTLRDQHSNVSLTTDIWTSDHSNKAFGCLTAHFIDDAWVLHKKILAFKLLSYPHDGDKIYNFVMNQMLEWNIDSKVTSIVVDNASANYSMINKVKEWYGENYVLLFAGILLHVRCSAHITNLVVQDGLAPIRELIDDIRQSVRYVERSPSAMQNFEKAKIHYNLSHLRSVAMDVPTRWNSTFEMLETAIPLREAFVRLKQLDKGYRWLPSADAWDLASVIVEYLRTFANATKHFSGSKYPTANIFFPIMSDINLKLVEWEKSENDDIKLMAIMMKEKFDKYWDDCNFVLAVATVFDPRRKMWNVKYFYHEIYNIGSKFYIDRVEGMSEELYLHYGGRVEEDSVPIIVDASSDNMARFKQWYASTQSSLVPKSELDAYLLEPLHPESDLDVLSWWEVNSPRFPIVAKIARDILVVPATTVASESAFSVGGRVIDERRSMLSASSVEALICANDWIPPIKKREHQNYAHHVLPVLAQEEVDEALDEA